MIHFFLGENSFEMTRELKKLTTSFDGEVRAIDAEDLTLGDLPDLLQGQTLFSDKRLVVVKQLSENKSVWDALHERVSTMSSDVTLVLVEAKPDKRTKTYKELVKVANVKEFPLWTARDTSLAVEWTMLEAKHRDLELTSKLARHLVERTGLDQWRLFHALEKLSLAGDVSIERINEVVEAHPDENVFQLLDTALRGDLEGVQRAIEQLRQTTDAYQTAGLLISQILQLTTLALSDKFANEVAKDIGAHPFVLSKLAPHAARLSVSEVKQLIARTAKTDMQMKSSGIDPWIVVEKLLLRIAAK